MKSSRDPPSKTLEATDGNSEGDNGSTKRIHKNPFSFLLFKSKHHLFHGNSGYRSVPAKKGTRSSSSNGSSANGVRGIFGSPLEYAMQCGSITPCGSSIPDLIHRCSMEIVKRGIVDGGLAVEGIFRLSSAASEVDQLYREFDKPPTYGKYLDLSTYDIHAIAGVMKKYLRCLPEAVIPNTYHHLFLQAADDLDDQGSPSPLIETLVSLVTQLPRAHRHLLHYIIQLASHVQRYSHVNMMNPEALAVVLAPVCTGFDQTLRDMRIMTLQTRHGSPLTSKNPASTIDRLVQLNAKWTYIWTHLIENREYLLKTWDAGSFDPLQLNHYWHPSSKPCIAQQSTPSTTSSGSTNSASPVPPYQILISQFQAEPETVQVAPPARVTQESSESGNDSSNYPKTSKHHQRYAVVVMRRRQQQNWIPSIDRVSKDDLDDTLPHRREDTSREASSSSLLRRHKSMVNLKKSVL